MRQPGGRRGRVAWRTHNLVQPRWQQRRPLLHGVLLRLLPLPLLLLLLLLRLLRLLPLPLLLRLLIRRGAARRWPARRRRLRRWPVLLLLMLLRWRRRRLRLRLRLRRLQQAPPVKQRLHQQRRGLQRRAECVA